MNKQRNSDDRFRLIFLSQLHWCIFTAKLLLLVHEIYRRILACRNWSQIYPYSLCIVLDLGKKIYYTDLKYPAATSTLHLVPNLSGHWLISTGLRCICRSGMNCTHPADVPSLPVVPRKFIHLFSAQNPCITISLLWVASTNLWFFDSLSQCMWELRRDVCSHVRVCVCACVSGSRVEEYLIMSLTMPVTVTACTAGGKANLTRASASSCGCWRWGWWVRRVALICTAHGWWVWVFETSLNVL